VIDRDPVEESEGSGGRSVFGILGFSLLAIIAVIAGVWFAMYWTRHNQPPPIAQASPTPSPAAVPGPIVQLAQTIPLQVSGDLAGGLERNRDSLGKVFADNKSSLVDVYGKALGSDAEFRDGMVVRIHIMPDGSVSDGSVRVSTSLNPSLDAEVINTLRRWKFAPAAGSVGIDADYPIIFASKPSDTAAIESDLKTKLASLGPNEAPEYASAASGAAASPSASPAAAASPEVSPAAPSGLAAAPPPEAPPAPAPAFEAPTETSHAAPAKPKHRRRELASTETRPLHHEPPLSVRVLDELHANRKLRRVQAFTNGSTVMLSGKVFDDNDKALALRTARSVDGVTSVMNNITTDEQDWARNAALIQQQLQNAGLSGVNVRVIGKSAYLDGEVKNPQDRDRAETIAVSSAPVIVRENLIRVAPGSMFGF
jgi:TonB family protein